MDETKVPLFWRLFGGTVLSILCVLMVALFGHMFSQINAVQITLGNLSSEAIRKTEFNERQTTIWNSLKSMESFREKLAVVEKALEKSETRITAVETLTALKDKFIQMDQDFKQTTKELNAVRERLAALEAKKTQP